MPTFYDPETGDYYQLYNGKVSSVGPTQPWEGASSNAGAVAQVLSPASLAESFEDFKTTGAAALLDYGYGVADLAGWDREQLQARRQQYLPAVEAAKERSPVGGFLGDNPEIAAAGLATTPAKALGLGAAEGLRMRDTYQDQAMVGGIGAISPWVVDRALGLLRAGMGMAKGLKNEFAQRAEDLGLPVTAGEVAPKSGGLTGLDELGGDLPGANMFSADPIAQRTEALNRAANEAIGESGETVTKENMERAARRVQADRADVSQQLGDGLELPPALVDKAREIFPRFTKQKALDQYKGLTGDNPTGNLSPVEALDLFGTLVKQADNWSNTDVPLKNALVREVIGPLDEMIAQKLGPNGADLWRRYRDRYRIWNILNEGKSVSGGNVNPAALRQRFKRNMPWEVATGDLDRIYRPESQRLIEMADLLGDTGLRSPGANSGTFKRTARGAGVLAPAIDIGLMSAGMPAGAATAGVGGLMIGNAAAQAAARNAPNLLGGAANLAGGPQRFNSLLDEILFPFVGQENEIEQ